MNMNIHVCVCVFVYSHTRREAEREVCLLFWRISKIYKRTVVTTSEVVISMSLTFFTLHVNNRAPTRALLSSIFHGTEKLFKSFSKYLKSLIIQISFRFSLTRLPFLDLQYEINVIHRYVYRLLIDVNIHSYFQLKLGLTVMQLYPPD